jgi:hypothetical protein
MRADAVTRKLDLVLTNHPDDQRVESTRHGTPPAFMLVQASVVERSTDR